MSDDFPTQPGPADDLEPLDHLVGTWEMSGGAEGTIRYEWMDGGHFLIQHVDLYQYGQQITVPVRPQCDGRAGRPSRRVRDTGQIRLCQHDASVAKLQDANDLTPSSSMTPRTDATVPPRRPRSRAGFAPTRLRSSRRPGNLCTWMT